MNTSTTMLASTVNAPGATTPLPSVSTTFRPTVQPPSRTNTVISAAAVVFFVTPALTDGPHATPVDDPPTLKPTNAAAATATTNRTSMLFSRTRFGVVYILDVADIPTVARLRVRERLTGMRYVLAGAPANSGKC